MTTQRETYDEWRERLRRQERAKDRERNLANVQRINRDTQQKITGFGRWEREYFYSGTKVSAAVINGS